MNAHETEKQDDAIRFFQKTGWPFGYIYVVDEATGQTQWQADAFKGATRFIARHESLGQALHILKQNIYRMN